jgi:hypothetical protein
MCGMEPFNGSTHSLHVCRKGAWMIFFSMLLGFPKEFEKSWKSICVFQKCVQMQEIMF